MRGVVLDWYVSDMRVPNATAPDPSQEGWQPARHLLRARIHSELGHRASWVEAVFAITSDGPFPWQRLKAVDRMSGTVIGIWRADTVRRAWREDLGLVWEIRGRDCLYGLEDNFIRTPLQKAGEGYSEWPTSLVPDPADFEESAFPAAQRKVGPNYAGKGALRGWIFKDITRFSAGRYDSPSRPIVAVYNRSQPKDEGQQLNSNFSLAQGVPANALLRDIAKAWPWPASVGSPGIGWDYRQVWPGREEPFSPSGQALEVFPRGSQLFSPPCFGDTGAPRAPQRDEGGRPVTPCGPVISAVVYFQIATIVKYTILDGFATRGDVCRHKPNRVNRLIGGLAALILLIFPDHYPDPIDLSPPRDLFEWISRWFPVAITTVGDGNCWMIKGIGPQYANQFCFSHRALGLETGVCFLYTVPGKTFGGLRTGREKCPFLPTQCLAIWLDPSDMDRDVLCCHCEDWSP